MATPIPKQKNNAYMAETTIPQTNISFKKFTDVTTLAPNSSSPFFERKHLQAIGCYLKRGFGTVRYRILRELGCNEYVCGVVELYYPKWCEGTIVGIPWRVFKR